MFLNSCPNCDGLNRGNLLCLVSNIFIFEGYVYDKMVATQVKYKPIDMSLCDIPPTWLSTFQTVTVTSETVTILFQIMTVTIQTVTVNHQNFVWHHQICDCQPSRLGMWTIKTMIVTLVCRIGSKPVCLTYLFLHFFPPIFPLVLNSSHPYFTSPEFIQQIFFTISELVQPDQKLLKLID